MNPFDMSGGELTFWHLSMAIGGIGILMILQWFVLVVFRPTLANKTPSQMVASVAVPLLFPGFNKTDYSFPVNVVIECNNCGST